MKTGVPWVRISMGWMKSASKVGPGRYHDCGSEQKGIHRRTDKRHCLQNDCLPSLKAAYGRLPAEVDDPVWQGVKDETQQTAVNIKSPHTLKYLEYLDK
jgi:hypothetical protein